jgi:Subtilase family/Secretion system C-terminal sorting domain
MNLNFILWFLALIACIPANAQKKSPYIATHKLSPTLQRFLDSTESGKADNSHLDLYKLVCTDSSELFRLFKAGEKERFVKHRVPGHSVYVVQIKDRFLLRQMLQLPSVVFADLFLTAREELEVSNFDPAVNRINALHQKYPLANGNGLTVSIKENIFDTLDIDFKGRYIKSSTESPTYSGHASIMATLAGGAGNTSAGSLGVSPGVNFTSSDFANLFPDPAPLFLQLNISVQNHSYGIPVENFYGAEARAYDLQLNAMPALAHVFSVGNSGLSTPETGAYAGLQGVANTTGNFKTAKNIISVAASDSFFKVPAAISKGPAFDGRLKPEITAFGEDGSSGAAAIVSGTIISLQHLYRQLYGNMPHTSLIRAVLFNSADDIGSPGIDYVSGYGSLNALKAANNMANGRFFSGSLAQGDTVEFAVSIPPGIKKAKFTLAWNDPANALLASKGLVNDADMEVVSPDGNVVFKPWVLNHFPHPDSLKQLPKRKTDTLNNAEQVTIDDPMPGAYKIRLYGSSIPVGPQSFFVAYQFDSASLFEFYYPVKNEQLQAGKSNMIRWNTNVTGSGTLLFSLDNVSWHTIAANIDLATGFFYWNTPDTNSSAVLKMIGSVNVTGDSFVISALPKLQIGYDCPDDFMLFWNKQENAAGYEIFRLGSKYMEPFAVQADTIAVFSKSSQPSRHYALRALLPNGVGAQRSYAYNYTTQGVECYIKSFLAELSGNRAELMLELGTTYGIKSLLIEKRTSNGFKIIHQVNNPAQLSYRFTDDSLITGINLYRVSILRLSGEVNYGNQAAVYYFGQQPYLVFPNPVPPGGFLHVVNASLNNGTFRLYNMAGQLVLNYATRNFEERIPVSGLQAGLYYYTISEEGNIVQKGKIMIL